MTKGYLFLILVLFLTLSTTLGQTPGLILEPATGTGSAVLDPNGDGYTSQSTSGFVSSDQSESEIPFVKMVFPSAEPTSDLGPGPDCGFTDFVDSGIEDPSLTYFNSATNNWFFRFRLGNIAPNSKGYSVLIDTDQKFGSSGPNADPNYTSANPGFEIEINLQTNFGVYVYNVDGTSSPVLVASHSGTTNYQKSIALTRNCGNADYFYDFFIPFSDITSNFPGITSSTSMRMAVTTQMSPQPAIGNNALSDIGGVDDAACGQVFESCIKQVVDNYPPTTPTGSNSTLSDRTACPTITGPILTGATTVSGTSIEGNGTLIKVFKDGVQIGTASVSSGSWSLTGISTALVSGEVITASATASGKSESISNCSSITVGASCTAPFVSGNVTGNQKGICGAAGAGISGATVFLYDYTFTQVSGSYTVASDGSFQWKCNTSNSNCSSGSGCLSSGSYAVTQKLGSQCESDPVWVCVVTSTLSATPTITTSPITSTTTSISGTGPASSTIILYINNAQKAIMTSNSSGSWTFGSLSLSVGDAISVKSVESGKCISNAATASVTGVTAAPLVTGTYCTSTSITSVTGTSTAPAGTVIQVYENGVAEGSTTTVTSSGTWTAATGISIASGSVITAKATTTGWSTSVASNSITVGAKTSNAVTITSTPILEGVTSISGTGTNGDVIRVYVDDYSIGTATVSGGIWSFSGLPVYTFYPNAKVYATATSTGKCESSPSINYTVQCIAPLTSKAVTPSTATICSGSTIAATVTSQSKVIYQIFNGATSVTSSKLGTGADLSFTTSALSSSGTLTVKAFNIYDLSCASTLSNSISVTVNPNPTLSLTVAAQQTTVCSGSSTNITISGSENGFTYQLRNNATNAVIGSSVVGNGGVINLSTGSLTSATTFNVLVTGVASSYCSGVLTTKPSVAVNPTPATPAASSNSPVCAGGTINLSTAAVAGATYSWTGPNGFTSSLQNPAITNATVAMGGSYLVTVTTNSCTSASGSTSVVVNSIPSTPTASSNSPVCAGGTINLSTAAVAGATYSWTGPNGFTSSLQNPTISNAMVTMGGSYFVTVTTNSCTSAAGSTSVAVNSIPSTPTASSNTPVCAGGTINLSTAAVAGATYSWTGPNGFTSSLQNPTITNATVAMGGSYSVTVTSNSCTSAAGTTSVVVNSIPSTPTASSNIPVCAGGTINLSTAAVAGATYSWTGPNGFTSSLQNPAITNATVAMGGSYSVTVTTNSCTSAAGSATVVVNSIPATPTASSNSPVCVSGTINLSTAAVAGATYSWTGPNGFTSSLQNPAITNATVAMGGSYSVTVTTNSCTSAAGSATVVVNSIPATPTASSNSPVCAGGTINLSTAAVAGATYSWTGPNGFTSSLQNPTITNATVAVGGSYSVTVTTNSCTSASGSTSVVVNSIPATPTASSNTPVCAGGTINLSTAAVAGATYSWTGPNGFTSSLQNPAITNATVAMGGSYSVTVTTNSCTSAAGSTSVVVNSIPSTPTASSNSPVCAGGTINLSTAAVAGATYSWTGPNGFTSSLQNPTITNATVAMEGSYSVTVTTNSCTSASGSTSVVVNSIPSTPTASSNTPVCAGGTINLSIAAVAGATYSWTGPNGFTSSLQNPTISNATVAMGGSYSVTVTTNSCTSAAGSTSVVVNSIPSTPTASSNSPVCEGGSINLLTAAVAGATYSWTGPNGFTSSLQNPTISNAMVTMGGSYFVTVTTNSCTSAAGSVVVNVNSSSAIPVVTSNSPVCEGGTINLSTPAVAGATYSWTGPNGFTSSLQNPTISNATVAMGGSYSVTVTTNSCTSAAGSTSVVVNSIPSTPTASSNSPVCEGGSINLLTTAVAGATYSWTGPSGFTSSLQNPTISNATVAMGGSYSVTVTTNSCTSAAGSTSVVVNSIPSTPTASSNTPVCAGGTINLSTAAIAGATYSWTGPNGFTSSLQNPTISNATVAMGGSYSVTVTTNSCTSAAGSTSVVVNSIPSTPTASSNSPVCAGGTINLSTAAVAGATYSWTGPNGFTSSLQNPTITNAMVTMGGSYFVTVTTNSCTSAAGSVVVNVNSSSAIPVVTSNSPVCEGGTINLSTPAVAGATYNWTGPNGFTSSLQNPTISNATVAMGGSYSVTVTTNSCTSAAGSTSVVVNSIPSTPTASSNSPICEGGSINLSTPAIVGATYSWTGPNGFTSSLQNPTISNATVAMGGSYSVTVTTNSCTSAAGSTSVVVNSIPSTPTASSNSPVCEGGSINLSTPAITGATYSWTGPNGFTSSLQNPTISNATVAMEGSYSVTVTTNSCTSAAGSTNVVVNSIPSTPTASSNTPVCAGGTINLSTAAVAGATYSWTGPNGFTSSLQNPTISNATVAMGGNYSVTVTTNSCTSAAGSTSVVVNSIPSTPTASSNTPVCAGGTINLSTAAIAGATYSWTGPNGFTSSLQNPTISNATLAMGGNYSVTVTTNSCTSAAGTVNVVVNSIPTTPTASSNSPICEGGTINLSTAAVAGATYSWTGPNGFTSSLQNPDILEATLPEAGNYNVTVTVNSCVSSKGSTTVVINTIPFKPLIGSNSPICEGGTINLSTASLTGATYNWSGPDGFTSTDQNPVLSNAILSMNGTYSLNVTIKGCTSPSATVNVKVENGITAAASNDGPYLEGEKINLSGTVGESYSWSGPDGFTSNLQNPTLTSSDVAKGIYTLSVTSGACSAIASTTVEVNLLPVSKADSFKIDEDNILYGNVSLNDDLTDGPLSNYTLIQGPVYGALKLNADGSFEYTPKKDSTGYGMFVYKLCDGGTPESCVSDTAVLYVTPVNDTPVVFNESYTSSTSSVIHGTFSNGDNDKADGTTLIYNVTAIKTAENGTFSLSNDGTFTYKAFTGFTGKDTVVISVCDSGNPLPGICVNDTLVITILPDGNNYDPVLSNEWVSQSEDQVLTGSVLDSGDSDPDGTTLVVESIPLKLPLNGIISVNQTGTYSYLPAKDFNGRDTVVLRVCDQGSPARCQTDTLFISITAMNDAPVVFNETASANAASVLHGTLANGDNDAIDGTSLMYNKIPVKAPAHGNITVNNDGSFSYTAVAGYAGKDTIVVSVCDSGLPLPSQCVNDTLIVDVSLQQAVIDSVWIGVAKEVLGMEYVANGSYNISYRMHVKNYSTKTINNISLTDDLNETFKGAKEVKINNAPSASGDLTPNVNYDGYSDIQLLVAGSSTLAAGDSATVQFTVNVKSDGGTYSNIAVASYSNNGKIFKDTSVAGRNPDINGNKTPNDPLEQGGVLVEIPKMILKIPDGFSPDGDGYNDRFVIEGLENYPDNSIEIYNRWGSLVYQKDTYQNDWDGVSINKLNVGASVLPAATYYYLLQLDKKDKTVIKGYIYINR